MSKYTAKGIVRGIRLIPSPRAALLCIRRRLSYAKHFSAAAMSSSPRSTLLHAFDSRRA